jgi:hypothetical protein
MPPVPVPIVLGSITASEPPPLQPHSHTEHHEEGQQSSDLHGIRDTRKKAAAIREQESLAPRPTPKLGDHSLLAVHYSPKISLLSRRTLSHEK